MLSAEESVMSITELIIFRAIAARMTGASVGSSRLLPGLITSPLRVCRKMADQ
jgi:hypothetical protein